MGNRMSLKLAPASSNSHTSRFAGRIRVCLLAQWFSRRLLVVNHGPDDDAIERIQKAMKHDISPNVVKEARVFSVLM